MVRTSPFQGDRPGSTPGGNANSILLCKGKVMTKEKLLPCPFCGKEMDVEDCDTLYPNGIGWMLRERHNKEPLLTYGPSNKAPKEQWCWSVHCQFHSGGCGAEISGDSKKEAIAAWNKRKLND